MRKEEAPVSGTRTSSTGEPAAKASTTDYNYAIFRGDDDFDAFMGAPHVGERAPDAALTDLDAPAGPPVALSALWQQSHLVLEFGSYT
jgi:hypothetical protein